MGLIERLRKDDRKMDVASIEPQVTNQQSTDQLDSYQELKERIHRSLIDKLDLTRIDLIPRDELRSQVRDVVENLLAGEVSTGLGFNSDKLIEEILNETFGLGPLEPLLNDPTISDILVNTHNQVYVERFGKLELTQTVFKDDNHLLHVIDRIVSEIGRRIDESSPMVDARLADGSRVNAIIPPLAIRGPMLSIRKFGIKDLTMDDLLKFDTLTPEIAELLMAIIGARLNVLISGGTGSGKTTLLNVLSGYISSDERILTIEDAAELQLQQPHIVNLETRQPNLEGQGEIIQRDLVRNALRMRPDRIIVGEVRGPEALDMLQAMNTGHDGSLTTLHANTPRDALRRLETMILMAGANLPGIAMREQISSAINVLVHISRLSDGSRKVMNVSEVTGMEGDVITLQDIFVYDRLGLGEDKKVIGQYKATGIRPKFVDKIEMRGISLSPGIFGKYQATEEL
jgi:pilus assembly protein CpaF